MPKMEVNPQTSVKSWRSPKKELSVCKIQDRKVLRTLDILLRILIHPKHQWSLKEVHTESGSVEENVGFIVDRNWSEVNVK